MTQFIGWQFWFFMGNILLGVFGYYIQYLMKRRMFSWTVADKSLKERFCWHIELVIGHIGLLAKDFFWVGAGLTCLNLILREIASISVCC